MKRRSFLKTAASVGIGTALGFLRTHSAWAQQQTLEGVWAYPRTYSLLPGESLKLHVRSSKLSVGVNVRKLTSWVQDGTWSESSLLTLSPVPVTPEPYKPDNATLAYPDVTPREDWRWNETFSISIPTNWASGIYIAEIAAYDAGSVFDTCWVEFVVRNPQPTGERILYKLNLNTIHAYNLGTEVSSDPYCNSFYADAAASPRDSRTGYKITLRRPVGKRFWRAKSIWYDYPLIHWLEKQGYSVDYCTDVDVHLDNVTPILRYYPVLVSSGHDEYWSDPMRSNAETYRDRGGNIAFLSGNTCCWRVHYGDLDGGVPTSMVCNKIGAGTDADVGDSWWRHNPENALVGVGTRNCAIRYDESLASLFVQAPESEAERDCNRGYRVQNADHWIFEGSTVTEGHVIGGGGDVEDRFGTNQYEHFIGYEGGGARLLEPHSPCSRGELAFTDGTPQNFALLGVAPTPTINHTSQYEPDSGANWWAFRRETPGSTERTVNGLYAATMGMYSSYGFVFTGSTIYWGRALNEWDDYSGNTRETPSQWQDGIPENDAEQHPILGNPHLHRITRNVLDAFLKRPRTVAGVADLNGDGKSDLVLQSPSTGEPSYWELDGTSRVTHGSIHYDGTSSLSRHQRIVGAGKLNGVTTHLVIQDDRNGDMSYWALADGTSTQQPKRTGRGTLGHVNVSGTWNAVALFDLNGDGRPDLLFQKADASGAVRYALLDGTNGITQQGSFAGYHEPGSNWRMGAVIQLNVPGLGVRDFIVFQERTTGALWYWRRNGLDRDEHGALYPAFADPVWQVVGSGDSAGGTRNTLFLQDRHNGDVYFWRMENTAAPAAQGYLTGANQSATAWYV